MATRWLEQEWNIASSAAFQQRQAEFGRRQDSAASPGWMEQELGEHRRLDARAQVQAWREQQAADQSCSRPDGATLLGDVILAGSAVRPPRRSAAQANGVPDLAAPRWSAGGEKAAQMPQAQPNPMQGGGCDRGVVGKRELLLDPMPQADPMDDGVP